MEREPRCGNCKHYKEKENEDGHRLDGWCTLHWRIAQKQDRRTDSESWCDRHEKEEIPMPKTDAELREEAVAAFDGEYYNQQEDGEPIATWPPDKDNDAVTPEDFVTVFTQEQVDSAKNEAVITELQKLHNDLQAAYIVSRNGLADAAMVDDVVSASKFVGRATTLRGLIEGVEKRIKSLQNQEKR